MSIWFSKFGTVNAIKKGNIYLRSNLKQIDLNKKVLKSLFKRFTDAPAILFTVKKSLCFLFGDSLPEYLYIEFKAFLPASLVMKFRHLIMNKILYIS